MKMDLPRWARGSKTQVATAGPWQDSICQAISFQHATGWHPSSKEGIGSSSSQQLLSTAQ